MEGRDGEQADEENQLLSRPRTSRRTSSGPWPTIDGPLGLSVEESAAYARRFFLWGICLLPLLWAVNCLYFWPVLRSFRSSLSQHHPFHDIRKYVVWSAIGLMAATVLISSWAVTFVVGGEHLFGPSWKDLVMYNVAEKYGLTYWT